MHLLATVLTIITVGFTASAIVANLYRMMPFTAETTSGHFVRVVILMFTGPSEIFEAAMAGRVRGEWSALAFWLAISGVCYWSLTLGFFVLQSAKSLAV